MRVGMVFLIMLVQAVCTFFIAGQDAGPRISAPDAVLHDEQFAVRVTGLKAGSTYGLRTEFYSRSGTIWRSEAQFLADEKGAIDLATGAPVSGSYTVADPLGPFWSMENTREKSTDASMFDNDDQSPVTLQVREGDKTIAQHVVVLRHRQIGVSTTEIRGDVTGTYFSSSKSGKMPGIIVLGGSEGGVPRPNAALIASHGFPTLALGYFGVEKLPADLERIPVETVDRGVAWLSKQPGVDPGRIVVIGMSKGAEFALLAASRNPRIAAVVAIAPSSAVFEGISQGKDAISSWTAGGVDLPFAPYVHSDEYTKSRRLIDLYNSTYDAAKPESKIPVEKIAGPIMLISGKADALWPSSRMADEIAARLTKNGFKYKVTNFAVDGVGHHVCGIPLRPTADSVRLGGTARAISHAQIDAWREMVAFLTAMKR